MRSRKAAAAEASAEALAEPAAVTSAARVDERARVVERQRRDAAQERLFLAVLVEVLFDVRQIERADERVVLANILTDRLQRTCPAEVADDRHDQIARLEVFDDAKRLVACEKAARHAAAVRSRRA